MAITFRSPCESAAAFDGIVDDTASSVTFGNVGTGYTGGSLRINYSGNFIAEFVKKTLSTPSDIVQLRFRVPSATTLNGTDDGVILSLFDNTSYGTSIGQIRLLGATGGFTVRIVDPSNSFATTVSGTVFTKTDYHTIAVKRKSTGIDVYMDVNPTPIITYAFTQTGTTFPAFAVGNFYSAVGSITGNVDFDDVFAKTTNTVSTEQDRIDDAVEGYIQRYHSNGAIVRPIDATGGQTAPDVVSEGIAYGLKLYVQNNRQTFFDETFTWAFNNMRRGSTVGGAPTTNTPADAFYLYGYKYNAVTQVMADGNYALDAEPEILQSLLWAHARWGSAGTVNYKARADEIEADLRTYGFRLSSGTGFQYLKNDSFQTGTTLQMGGDYDDPAAWKLIAQWYPANAAFWNSAVSGTYDYQTKAANYVFSPQVATSKLTPNWSAMTLSTAAISGTSTYGDSDWGYNSFRFHPRAYDDYKWYGSAQALTWLQLSKSFLASQYSANTAIYAEYLHSGANKGTPYESGLFYYPYYFSLFANDPSNTTASAIASSKFPSYTQNPSGGYFGAPGYFGDSWLPIYRMQTAGTYANYGQASNVARTFITSKPAWRP